LAKAIAERHPLTRRGRASLCDSVAVMAEASASKRRNELTWLPRATRRAVGAERAPPGPALDHWLRGVRPVERVAKVAGAHGAKPRYEFVPKVLREVRAVAATGVELGEFRWDHRTFTPPVSEVC
jgi:hypothetical protein